MDSAFCSHGYLFGNGCMDCLNATEVIPIELGVVDTLAGDIFSPIALALLDMTDDMRDLRIDVANPPHGWRVA